LEKKMFSTLTSYIDDRRMAGRLAAACWAATLSGFMALQIYKALRKPMSMIDDGYHALIARSVAEKFEYSLPISSDATNIFSGIGAGPALILPGAGAIKLFGAHAWVPGFVVIFLFESLLLATTVALFREYSPPRAMLFVTIGLVGLVAVTPAPLDLYYVFYGEALQLGFLLLGCILLAQVNNGSIIWSALAGTTFGLAILSKQSSVYCMAGATIAWAAFLLFRNPRRMWYAVASYVVTLSMVVLSFEAAKLFVMGWKGYADNLAEILGLVGYFHSRPHDAWARAMDVVKFKYFIDVPMAVFVGLAAVMAYFIAIRMNEPLPVILLAAASMHCIYWSFFSRLWDSPLVARNNAGGIYSMLGLTSPAALGSGAVSRTVFCFIRAS
jgi:hypothetical protein